MMTSVAAVLACASLAASIAASSSASAARCCAGSFIAKGRGAVYPPIAARGKAFDFVMTFDSETNRIAQRALPGAKEDMGTLWIGGVGHYMWTNSSNCMNLYPKVRKYIPTT